VKIYILFIVSGILFFVISGCAPAYNNSIVIERPKQPIKQVLIIIEQPSFSSPTKESDGTLTVNTPVEIAINRYRTNLNVSTKKNFVKVMSDNSINSKLIFMPALSNPKLIINLLPLEEQKKWQYILLIRHVKGMSNCRYGQCDAFFQMEAKIIDSTSFKTIWNAKESGSTYYGDKVWQDGRMYKYLLERLNVDNMIKLENIEPIIQIDQN
jgi:hypothetical protein